MPVTIKFANRQVRDILADIRADFESVREMGDNFERLFGEVAMRAPELEVKGIWQWRDWPERQERGFTGLDYGVDLVAELTGGQLVAIQCKFYSENYKVDKSDVQSFIAGADPKVFSLRWFVATTDYTATAEKVIRQHDVRVIDFRQYAHLHIGKLKFTKRAPLPLQQDAIDAVCRGFTELNETRGRLIMACGTGKTFTALRIAEQIAPSGKNTANILFIAPSIALVAQARKEWLTHTARRLAVTVICSDQTAKHGSGEDIAANEISCEVTTDARKIAANLNRPIEKGTARVVFCTYQSLFKLRDAQHRHGAPEFDIAIIDEAHRTAGYLGEEGERRPFKLIHYEDEVRIQKRLYMTATPRIYQMREGKEQINVTDMNDEEYYGKEFYRLSFKKAVNAGMLCDYRVIALGIYEGMMSANLKDSLLFLNKEIGGRGRAADEQAVLALGAIALALNGFVEGENQPGVLARTIAYASNIRRSKWLAQALCDSQVKGWITRSGKKQDGESQSRALTIVTEHLDGTSSALKRNAALRNLNYDASDKKPRLISNAQLFTEGVDVPALNAVAFLDPRQSKVDTIQAVGRVMRSDESKALGYIIVPVILPEGAELLDVLDADKSRFKTLGVVLRALQSHDERLYTELSDRLTFATAQREKTDDSATPPPPPPPASDYEPIQLSLLDGDAKQAIYAKIAHNVGIAQRGKILADAITQAVEQAARLFEQENATPIIADTIGTPSDNEKESCKTAALLIVNACIMHKRLEETGNLADVVRIENAKLTKKPSEALFQAWRSILKKDYAPVFQDATALVRVLSDKLSVERAIGVLIQCAIDNATTLNELGFDHAGPLYHKVLGTAQSDGAYYTKNLSGYLLAGLAFDENFTDWSDAEKVNKLRVIDPACGTGTLLMAALNIIKKRAAEAQNLTDDEVQKLHKRLVETGIYGLDINKYSVQLAACNLTIGAPNTDYKRINLHTVNHGPVKGKVGDRAADVRHGTLEKLLETQDSQIEILEPPPVYGVDVTKSEMKEVLLPTTFDVAICNPPFTDTNKQSRRYNEVVMRAMTKRLKFLKDELQKHEPAVASAIGRGSVRPFFTPLVTGFLPEASGKVAKVVPATACTSENGRDERQYIAKNYHIEKVVTLHDPRQPNFSENTSIHECLIIGARNENNSLQTRFIQIAKYPSTVEAVDELIDAIQCGKASDLYSETVWSAEKMREGDWSPVQWFNSSLTLVVGEINRLPNLVNAKSVCPVTYVGQAFRGNFKYQVKKAARGKANTFCTIAEDIMQTMRAEPETEATFKDENREDGDEIWKKASRFLIAVRFSTTSSRLLAIYSETPSFGSAWYALAVANRKQAKAFVAFINSSFGVIQMLNRRTKKLTYPQYEVGHLNTLMLPDPTKANLTPLLAAFEKVKDTPLEKLANCATDPSRKILDHAAAKAIGVDPKLTNQWRKWLSQEPTITNKPHPNE